MVSRIQKCKRRQKRSNVLTYFDPKARECPKVKVNKFKVSKKNPPKNCPKNQKKQNLRNHV